MYTVALLKVPQSCGLSNDFSLKGRDFKRKFLLLATLLVSPDSRRTAFLFFIDKNSTLSHQQIEVALVSVCYNVLRS